MRRLRRPVPPASAADRLSPLAARCVPPRPAPRANGDRTRPPRRAAGGWRLPCCACRANPRPGEGWRIAQAGLTDAEARGCRSPGMPKPGDAACPPRGRRSARRLGRLKLGPRRKRERCFYPAGPAAAASCPVRRRSTPERSSTSAGFGTDGGWRQTASRIPGPLKRVTRRRRARASAAHALATGAPRPAHLHESERVDRGGSGDLLVDGVELAALGGLAHHAPELAALAERGLALGADPLVGQVPIHLGADRLGQPVSLHQVPEVEDRVLLAYAAPLAPRSLRTVRNTVVAELDAREVPHGVAVITASLRPSGR